MRAALALLVSLVAAAVGAASAGANGSAYSPGLAYGWDGVRAAGAPLRYVTLGSDRTTVVAAVQVRGGRVVRSNVVRGFYGVPLVAYDGTTGGVSGNGRSLVLGSDGPLPGERGTTGFVVLDTRSLRPRQQLRLPGSWSFDAISPDGSLVYLVEHLSAGTNPRYRVRVYDLETDRLVPGAIVDRVERETVMRGRPVTRATSADGRWAYTLYARPAASPFVHALDTQRSEAFCVDLPIRAPQAKQMGLRLRLQPSGDLRVVQGRVRVAAIDTRALGAT